MTFEEAAAVMMGGSGTGANASFFSAICSLPVVAEYEIKTVNDNASGYKARVHYVDKNTPGYQSTSYSSDYIDEYASSGDFTKPGYYAEFEYYYCALCKGEEVICILIAPNRMQTYSESWTGGGEERFISFQDTRENTPVWSSTYNEINGYYVNIGFDVISTIHQIQYKKDDDGNIVVDRDITSTNTYEKGVYFQFKLFSTGELYHNYKHDSDLRYKLLQFMDTVNEQE